MAPPTPADRPPSLTLGPAAFRIRRAVGPIAWAVLECVAAGSVESGADTVSHQSVRGVAEALGLAKDTVARALRRLAAERLVAYVGARSRDGRFGESHYRLTLPADLFLDLCAPASTQTTPDKPPSTTPDRPSRRLLATQLSPIDPIPTGPPERFTDDV
jgi:hypothetical protein